MNYIRKIITLGLTFSLTFGATSNIVLAAEEQTIDVDLTANKISKEQANELINEATNQVEKAIEIDSQDAKEVVKQHLSNENDNSKFANEMQTKSEQIQSEIDQEVEEAISDGEKVYSLKEILTLSHKELGISKEDMIQIKNSTLIGLATSNVIAEEVSNMPNGESVSTEILNDINSYKIPSSMIKIDHSETKMDGEVSALAGWPGCVDNNGFGYKNFINSDCFWSLTWFPNCFFDSSIGKAMYAARYCKYNVRNCSPLIGHPKHAHKH